MTREEAVAVLEAFIENPLFNNTHKAAFNIAIHDIKQRHDWDINNLILINKENYEPIDREILDRIKAMIERIADVEQKHDEKWAMGLRYAVKIIDKYRGSDTDEMSEVWK